MKSSNAVSGLAGALFLAGILNAGNACAGELKTDPATGMKIAPGWEVVRNNCIACHSARQFLRQKGTATTWTEIIRWMQDAGGLWPLTRETEATIVSYLSEHYGPSGDHRRAPIPATLMPDNPYPSETRRNLEKTKPRRPSTDTTSPDHASGDVNSEKK